MSEKHSEQLWSDNPALPKLLRAIAGGTMARETKHDVILNAAADEIEELRNKIQELEIALDRASQWESWNR